MPNLIQRTDEASYRARADRSIQSGRVVSIDKTTNEAFLDVGMVDANGNAVYMHGAAFSPQSPPQPQDTVPLLRTNSSPYSMVIGSGAQVGGANSGQVVQAGGAVTSLRKTGEASGQQGDITLDPGTGVTITRTGKIFTVAASGAGAIPAPSCAGQVLTTDGASALWGKITTDRSANIVVDRQGDVVFGRGC